MKTLKDFVNKVKQCKPKELFGCKVTNVTCHPDHRSTRKVVNVLKKQIDS